MRDGAMSTLVAASRPYGWMIFPTFALAGMFAAGASPTPIAVAQLVLMTFPLGLVVFGLNDVYDRASDAINPRKGSLDGARLDAGHQRLVTRAAIASAVPLELSAIASFNATNILGMTTLLVCSYAYSVPPLRLKERPPADALANGFILLGAFVVGFSHALPIERMDPKWYLLVAATAGIHAFSTTMDYTPDRSAGYRTFAIVFGKRIAAIFALIATVAFTLSLDVPWHLRGPLLLSSLLFLIGALNVSEFLAKTLFRIGYVLFLLVGIGLAIAVFKGV